MPAETRRVLAGRPPLTPADFSGLRLRIVDDPQSAATFEALGTQVIQGLSSRDVNVALEHDRLDAAGTRARARRGEQLLEPTSPPLGLRHLPEISERRGEPACLGAPVAGAAGGGSRGRCGGGELGALCRRRPGAFRPQRALCCRGPDRGTQRSAAAVAQAAQPALASLASNPAASRVLDAMRGLPGAGPQPLAAPLPDACRPGGGEDGAERVAFPEGVYVVRVTAAQFRAAGVPMSYDEDTVLTTTFRRGRWTQTVTPTFPDQCADVPTPSHPACSGSYHVKGNRLTLVWGAADPAAAPRAGDDGVQLLRRRSPVRSRSTSWRPVDARSWWQRWRKIG